jgi:hypothetical protein
MAGRTCASPLVTAASQRARCAEPLQPAGWIAALHLDSTVPFEALTAVLEDGVLWQMKSYEKSDREGNQSDPRLTCSVSVLASAV